MFTWNADTVSSDLLPFGRETRNLGFYFKKNNDSECLETTRGTKRTHMQNESNPWATRLLPLGETSGFFKEKPLLWKALTRHQKR